MRGDAPEIWLKQLGSKKSRNFIIRSVCYSLRLWHVLIFFVYLYKLPIGMLSTSVTFDANHCSRKSKQLLSV